MDLPEWIPPETRVEAHVGWREDLWDPSLRVQGGVGLSRGTLGAELVLAARLGPDPQGVGDVAAARTLLNDGGWFATRDDLGTLAFLVTWAPLPGAVGPVAAVGPELALLQPRFFDDSGERAEGMVGDETPFVTLSVAGRVGIEGRVGRVGLRATLTHRLSALREPTFDGTEGPIEIVGGWRSGIDLLVRL